MVPSTSAITVASSATCTLVSSASRTPVLSAARRHHSKVRSFGGQANDWLALKEFSTTSSSGT